MPFSFRAREAGRVHVCGHRGLQPPLSGEYASGIRGGQGGGATTVEIDVVLTADGEPIVLYDRTIDGHGFATDLNLERIHSLDAGAGFNSRFAGTRVPTLVEVPDWAMREEMGLMRSSRALMTRRPQNSIKVQFH